MSVTCAPAGLDFGGRIREPPRRPASLLARARPGGGRHVEEDDVVVGRPEGGHVGDGRDGDPRAGVGAPERETAEGGTIPPAAAGGVTSHAERAAVRPEGADEHPPAGVAPARGG